MRILVTGGAGYVGAAVARYLIENGHRVAVLDDLSRGCAACVPEQADFFLGDVGDVVSLERIMPHVDAVVHCAAFTDTRACAEDPGECFETNVCAPLRLLRVMGNYGVDRLVSCSSVEVYGAPEVVPVVEGAMTTPTTPVGETKMMFERMCGWFERPHGLRTVSLRLSEVAGAWPDGTLGEAHDPERGLIARLLRAIAGGATEVGIPSGYATLDGTPVRDYVHVLDVARAVGLAMDWIGGGGRGGTFNIASGRGYSAREVADACQEVTGVTVDVVSTPVDPTEPPIMTASFDLAERTFGWRPDRGVLHTIVSDAWRWHSAHGEGYERV